MVFWREEWQKPSFQVYGSLLFGLPLAVTSFNRYSKFVEAMGRRLLRIFVSLYFDDAHLTDWVSNGPSAQRSFAELNSLLRTPFAKEKRQTFASSGTLFLGLDFNFEPVAIQDLVAFWARDRLLEKVTVFIADARETGRFTPGGASKLYGTEFPREWDVWPSWLRWFGSYQRPSISVILVSLSLCQPKL